MKEILKKLEAARAKQRKTRQEIDRLRKIVFDAGGDPDAPKIDLIPRNKLIYKRWKDANNFSTLAKEFKLSSSRIASICRRIEWSLETKRGAYKTYKDLMKYK